MQLLMAKQVSGLLPVLRLAGAVSEDPALQFLKVRSTCLMLSMQLRSSDMNEDQPGWTTRRQHPVKLAGHTQQSGIWQAVMVTRYLTLTACLGIKELSWREVRCKMSEMIVKQALTYMPCV